MKNSRHKFNARMTPCKHGHLHDSGGEAKRCNELHLLLKAKKIASLDIEPKIELVSAFLLRRKKYAGISYWPDFSYVEVESGKIIYEDFKGFQTATYKIKRKLFLARMARTTPDADWEFREVSRAGTKVY